jgi:hypothetical protein
MKNGSGKGARIFMVDVIAPILTEPKKVTLLLQSYKEQMLQMVWLAIKLLPLTWINFIISNIKIKC